MVKTYILAGYSDNLAAVDDMPEWEARARKGDLVILRPKPNQTMADLASQIKTPANIIIEAHGSDDGSFTWDKGHIHFYSELFQALPRQGIQSVTVAGCYGESAVRMSEALPHGTILQSLVGSKVPELGFTPLQLHGSLAHGFGKETASEKEITPLSIMLNALDNTDPAVYKKTFDELKNILHDNPQLAQKEGVNEEEYNLNPNDVLPHTIGIGGNPPLILNLNQKMAELSSNGKSHRLNEAQFQQAVAQVKTHFDHNNPGVIERTESAIVKWIGDKTGYHFDQRSAEAKYIDEVARKLKSGADTSKFTIEEKRIGYALTIANLYATGEMDRLVAQQKKTQQVSWSGQGIESTAKLQAIAELVFHIPTDRGGADDHHVSGVNDSPTNAAIKQLKDHYHLSDETTQQELLIKLMHDPQVMAVFGKTSVMGFGEVADVVVMKSNTPAIDTQQQGKNQKTRN